VNGCVSPQANHFLVSIRSDFKGWEQVALQSKEGVYALLDKIFFLVCQFGFTFLCITFIQLTNKGLPEGAELVLSVCGKDLADR